MGIKQIIGSIAGSVLGLSLATILVLSAAHHRANETEQLRQRVEHCEQAATANHINQRACTWIRGQYIDSANSWF